MNSVFGENTVRFYHVHVRLPVCFRTCISLEEWLNEFYIYYVPRNDSDLSDKFTLTQLAAFTAFFLICWFLNSL